MKENKLISVIVPCYNEEEVLPMFYEEIQKISAQMQQDHPELDFEYMFIDDGSKDRTLSILRDMARKDSRVRFVSFSRNFGKEAGMYAGLSNAKGDYCVVMDADLQHPPAFLPTMYEAVASGCYDCATTRRVSREGESKVRSWFARLFYKIMNKISQTEIVDGAQDFRFMTRQMVDAVLAMAEKNRFSKGIFSWVGFRVKYIEYENVERAAGTTSWSFWGLFRYSIEGILGFSTFPLALSTICGSVLSAAGLVSLIVALIVNHATDTAAGAGTVIAALILFTGIQLISVGVLGMYLGKMYLEVKNRPVYLVRETEQNFEQFPDPEVYRDLPNKQAGQKAISTAKSKAALSQAERLKQETDREFDAIVRASMQDDEEEPEEEAYEDADGFFEDEAEEAYEEAAEEIAEEPEVTEEPEAEETAAEPEEPEAAEEPADEEPTAEEAEPVKEAAPEQKEEPAKKKFEVKIDYDSIDDYDDEADDSEAEAEPAAEEAAEESAEPDEPATEEAEADAEYDEAAEEAEADEEIYDDDEYEEDYGEEYDEYDEGAYEEEYEEEEAPVQRAVRKSAAPAGGESIGDKLSAFWGMLREKFAGLLEKLNSDRTIDAYEAAIDAADPQDDDYDPDYDEEYDEMYDDDAYDDMYDDDDAYYEEDDPDDDY